MRVLFVTSPGIGHIFPTVTTAHAFRAAGQEVLYALGGHLDAVAAAGMQVVDTAPGVDFAQIFGQFVGNGQRPRSPAAQTDPTWPAPLFAKVSEVTVDATMSVGTEWQPDLVISTPLQGAGPLVAAKLGVPVVEHGIGFGSTGRVAELLRDAMRDSYERYGARPAPPDVRLSVTPPSMTTSHPNDRSDTQTQTWPMRYVPYNGGGVLPDWLRTPPSRPRIAVTLGTALPRLSGLAGLSGLLAAAAEVDADMVLALGGVDTSELGALPSNVGICEQWVPWGALLRTCAGAIHHGGAGTTLTALDSGIPQLVLPHGADQHYSAEAVRARGVGRIGALGTITVADIERLVDDEAARAAAVEVRSEMASMPAPAEIASRLASLPQRV